MRMQLGARSQCQRRLLGTTSSVHQTLSATVDSKLVQF